MYRKAINVFRKFVHEVGSIYKSVYVTHIVHILTSIYQPTNKLNKIQKNNRHKIKFMTSIKL